MADPIPRPDLAPDLASSDQTKTKLPLGLIKAIVLLGGLYVLAAWGFAGHGITDMLLVVVSLFVAACAGIVSLLYRARRHHPRTEMGERETGVDSFGNWLGRDIETSTGTLRGSTAAAEILLPIAAVAVGMVAFAIVLHFAT